MKFAANLNMLFTEFGALVERYAAARAAGFKAVECSLPYDTPAEELGKVRKEQQLEHVLINTYPGDWSKGERGFAAVPGKEKEFRDSLQKAIHYAKLLNCSRIHIMSGCHDPSHDDKTQWKTLVDNLKYAADELNKESIQALIEPINSRLSMPGYYMDDPHKALKCIKEVNHPNLKLQLDIFHMQIMDGNLTQNIKQFMPDVGHIQIAQTPGRGEPDSPGEINYPYVLKVIEETGYTGWIGLEYIPVGKTTDGLNWLKSMGYSL